MVTGLYAGILALIYIGLSFMVIRQRFAKKVGVGDAGNEDVLRIVRVHANFAEYVPMALVMMVLVELNTASPFEPAPIYLHIIGGALVVARLAHAYGLAKSAETSPGRFVGTIGTFLILIGLAGLLIAQFVTA